MQIGSHTQCIHHTPSTSDRVYGLDLNTIIVLITMCLSNVRSLQHVRLDD